MVRHEIDGSPMSIFHQLKEENLSHHAHTLPRNNLHPPLLPGSIADVLLSCRRKFKKSSRTHLPGCCFLGRIIFGSLGLFCKAISQTTQLGDVCCGVNSTSTAGGEECRVQGDAAAHARLGRAPQPTTAACFSLFLQKPLLSLPKVLLLCWVLEEDPRAGLPRTIP